MERRAAEIAAPAPGTVRVHNEGETWQAISPTLQAQDAGAGARLFRNHALSGLGWPEHWFGGGGDVNRATAAEMGDPAFKTLLARRREWTAILEEVGALVVRRRLDPAGRGVAPLPPPLAPRVEWPELVARRRIPPRGGAGAHRGRGGRSPRPRAARRAHGAAPGARGGRTAGRDVRPRRRTRRGEGAGRLRLSPKARRSAAPAASTAARASSRTPGGLEEGVSHAREG